MFGNVSVEIGTGFGEDLHQEGLSSCEEWIQLIGFEKCFEKRFGPVSHLVVEV